MDLGPLEMRVLGLLTQGEARSVAQIRRQLGAGGHELAYTTVMTVLTRLVDKGVARRIRDGRRYLYASASDASQVKRGILNSIGAALFSSDKLRPIAALLDDETLSEEELRQLRALIDARLEDG